MAEEQVKELTEDQGSVLFGAQQEETNEVIEDQSAEEVSEDEAAQEEVDNSEASDTGEDVQKQEELEESQDVAEDSVEETAEEEEVEDQEQKTEKKVVRKYKDERHAAIDKYIEENGSEGVADFIAKYDQSVDGLSDLDAIRHKIDSDPSNRGLSSAARKRLLDKELEKYNLDSEYEDDVEFGKELLKRDASQYRRQTEKETSELRDKYKSELEITEEVPSVPTEAEIQQQRDAMKARYAEKLTPLVKDGILKISDKEGEVNIPFKDASELVDAAMDPVSLINKAVVKDGNIDYSTFAEIAAFIKNPGQFKSNLIKYGKGLGTTSTVDTIKNAAPLGKGVTTEDSVVMTPQSHPLEFLKQAKVVRRN